MYKQTAAMIAAGLFLGACTAGTPEAKTPLPAHQAEAQPAPHKNAAAPKGDDGKPNDGSKKTKLSFSIPPTWHQVPQEAVKAPWLAGFTRPDVHGLVLMDFNSHSTDAAAKAAKDVHDNVCAENHWNCDDVVPMADGTGASFTFSTDDETRGKIALRDLDGPGRSQINLFGMWQKEGEESAAKDLDTMISTASVE